MSGWSFKKRRMYIIQIISDKILFQFVTPMLINLGFV